MAWTGNPGTQPLLLSALALDKKILEQHEAENPGTLLPTQAVVSDGDEFEVDEGTVLLSVADNAVTALFTPT